MLHAQNTTEREWYGPHYVHDAGFLSFFVVRHGFLDLCAIGYFV